MTSQDSSVDTIGGSKVVCVEDQVFGQLLEFFLSEYIIPGPNHVL